MLACLKFYQGLPTEAQIGTREEMAVTSNAAVAPLAANNGSGRERCPAPWPRPLRRAAASLVGGSCRHLAPAFPLRVAAGSSRKSSTISVRIILSRYRPAASRSPGRPGWTEFDSRLAVREVIAGGAVTLTYDDRSIISYAAPAEADTAGWAATIEAILAAARQTSPQLAALPAGTVEQAVVDGMTRSLDRFSRYAPPDLARDQRAARNGWGGIGITVDGANDTFRVTAVEPQSPADRAGIRPEDQIVAIDGVTTHGCVHREVVDRLRGPVGSPIAVQIVPAGMGQSRELRLQRATVFEPTVTASRDGDIGVIRVHSFNHRTTTRVAKSLTELQGQADGRLAGIVLDLRSNPGGVLDEAVRLADLFLRQGPIVSVVGRHPASRQYFVASGREHRPRCPDGRADQWRLRLGLRDRRRGASGCRSRRRDRQLVLRQGIGADRASPAQQRRADPDLGAADGALRLSAASAWGDPDDLHRRSAGRCGLPRDRVDAGRDGGAAACLAGRKRVGGAAAILPGHPQPSGSRPGAGQVSSDRPKVVCCGAARSAGGGAADGADRGGATDPALTGVGAALCSSSD